MGGPQQRLQKLSDEGSCRFQAIQPVKRVQDLHRRLFGMSGPGSAGHRLDCRNAEVRSQGDGLVSEIFGADNLDATRDLVDWEVTKVGSNYTSRSTDHCCGQHVFIVGSGNP